MPGGFRLALVQTRPRLADRAANLAAMARAVRSLAADLYIFPELASTGYALRDRSELLRLAERPEGGEGLDALQSLAEESGAAIVAGLPLAEGEGIYNAAALLRPGVAPVFYRKIHLFYRERELFDPGLRPPEVYDLGGLRLGMMICFDWIFPETARLIALAGADLIAHPANLVLSHCQTAMVTRSLENGVFSATANRVGEERYADGETLAFTGRSQVIDPRGKRLMQLAGDEEGIDLVVIEPGEARDKWITASNHLLADRRPAQYGALLGEAGDES